MKETLEKQYEMVRQSREVLLAYCATLADRDFVADNSSFGRGNIRNLLVHIVNVYEFWIGKHGLKKAMEFTEYEKVNTVKEIRPLFGKVDKLMAEFLNQAEQESGEIRFELNGKKMAAGYLTVFSHVITHEFHHKGQILSLSRHLGYTPVDTDIIR